jgi:hypothetical protein
VRRASQETQAQRLQGSHSLQALRNVKQREWAPRERHARRVGSVESAGAEWLSWC